MYYDNLPSKLNVQCNPIYNDTILGAIFSELSLTDSFYPENIFAKKFFFSYQNSLINHASRNAGITNPPIDAIANSKQNIWLDDREKEGFKHHPIPLLVSKTFNQWIRGHNVFCNWV